MTSTLWSRLLKTGLYLPLLLPLVFISGTYIPWHFGKTLVFEVVVELLAVAWLFSRWGAKSNARWWQGWHALDWAVLGFLGVLVITTFSSVNPAASWWGTYARASGVFTYLHWGVWYWLLRATWRERRDWQRALWLVVVVAVLVSVTIWLEPYWQAPWQSISGGGILGNRAFAGGYLLVAAGLSLLAALVSVKAAGRYVFLALAGWLVVTLLSLGVRGGFVGLSAAVLVGFSSAIIFVRSHSFGLAQGASSTALRHRARFRATLALVILIVIGGGAAFMVSRGTLADSFPKLSSLFDISHYPSGTGETRLLAWRIALQGWRERPLLGWGWETYEAVFTKYYHPRFLRYSFAETVWDKPHNWPLEILATSGAVGGAAYIFIFAISIYALVQSVRRRIKEPAAALGFIAGPLVLLAILIGHLVESLFLFPTTNTLLLLFLVLALVNFYTSAPVAALAPSVISAPQAGRGRVVVLLVALPAVTLSLWSWHVLPLRAAGYLEQGTHSPNAEVWNQSASDFLGVTPIRRPEGGVFLAEQFTKLDKAGVALTSSSTVAVAERLAQVLEQAALQYPHTAAYRVWAGQVYMVLGEKVAARYYADAERNLLAARELSPRKQDILFLVGRLYLLTEDFPKAIAAEEAAVAADPAVGVSHWFLGLARVISGDTIGGLKDIETARSLGYTISRGDELYVLDLYAEVKDYKRLIAGYQKLLDAEPDNITWYVRLATAYALAGHKAEAWQIVEQAVKLFPPLKGEAEKFIKEYRLR